MTSTATKGLTKTQINRFKRMLDAKALEIRANLQSSSAAKALARGDEPPDLEELPGQSHEEWIFLNRNNIEALLLREIDEALDRIEDGGLRNLLGARGADLSQTAGSGLLGKPLRYLPGGTFGKR